MRTLVVPLLASICVASGCASPTAKPVTLDFAHDTLGRPPARFSQALTGDGGAIVWAVRVAPEGGHVLAQESADAARSRLPLCIYDGFVARDVAAEVRFRAIDGLVDQSGGLVLRYRPGNYYLACVSDLQDRVSLSKIVDGKAIECATIPVPLKRNAWHALRFTAERNHLTVALDGNVAIEADDSTFDREGKVGVATKSDTVGAFDDLVIAPLR